VSSLPWACPGVPSRGAGSAGPRVVLGDLVGRFGKFSRGSTASMVSRLGQVEAVDAFATMNGTAVATSRVENDEAALLGAFACSIEPEGRSRLHVAGGVRESPFRTASSSRC
jgi:hypothetical protein